MVKEIDILPDFTPGELTFLPIPKYQYKGTLQNELNNGLLPSLCVQMLEVMATIRAFETTIADMKNGAYTPLENFKFTGATHLSIGQEAVAAGVMANLHADDYITSSHRGHGHSIAKGMFGLYSMDNAGLSKFIGKTSSTADHGQLLDEALDVHLYKTIAELFGRDDGYCKGRGGGMHIADFNMGHLGANAIVGGGFAIATGAAIASEKLKNGRIAVCLIGDGACCNGIALESMNMASMAQFTNGCPIIYLVENNQYMMTGQQSGEVTGVDFLVRRGAGVDLENMHAELVNGMDVLAVWNALKSGVEKARTGKGPIIIECSTYRYLGHSLSDMRTTYRTKKEEEAWQAIDCLKKWKEDLISHNILSAAEVEQIETKAKSRVHKMAEKAARAKMPEPKDIYEGLFSNTIESTVPPEYQKDTFIKKPRKYTRDTDGCIMYRHAVAEAITEEMMRDKRVVLFGEDVADYGGAFQATVGLLSTFGRDRVFNTAISESAIVGAACGMAMAGMRPVAEIMYIDFMLMAMDQCGNQLAKTKYMFGGKALIPAVVRTTVGGGKGYAGQHSQSLEAIIAHMPGLKIAAPSTAHDAKGLLKTAIRDNDPVIFIEHQLLYTEKGQVPEEDYTIPFGQAIVRREGKDVTIIAYSYMAKLALDAADRLAKEDGINIEVVDPRTLYPLDIDTLAKSVQKTGRVAVLSQAPAVGCFGEHILYEVQQRAFRSLKCPGETIAARNVPPPMAQPLEEDNIPGVDRIIDIIKRMVR